MLLAALPSWIKSDIIANRKLTAASIMLEVMKRFQPGGLGRHRRLLRHRDGVEKLRLWSRNVARAVELGVTLPDPVLQIGALDSICRQILNKEPQINFRVQSWRHSNNLDTTTQQSVVTRFAQLLQAELTTAALTGDRKEAPEAKVKNSFNFNRTQRNVRRRWHAEIGAPLRVAHVEHRADLDMIGLAFRTRMTAVGSAHHWVIASMNVQLVTRQSHWRRQRAKAKTPKRARTREVGSQMERG